MSKADKVARFPCDNCGQSGHWSYNINCPNYEVYLEKQRVKAETLRANRAAGGGTVALRNNTTGNLNKITKEKDYAYGVQKRNSKCYIFARQMRLTATQWSSKDWKFRKFN
jgi:hypothetical protein